MSAIAPAKVILSGEHAVVYGAPALAAAVQRYATATVSATQMHGQLQLQLPDLNLDRTLPLNQLAPLHRRCQRRHQDYLAGRLPIGEVASADEMLLSALAPLFDEQCAERAPEGLRIRVTADIPVGAGMGSSAATTAALLAAASHHIGVASPPAILCKRVQAVEQLQHGRSSGLDPAISVYGGLARFQEGGIHPLDSGLPGRWWLVNSGRPQVSTGDCVERVRRDFADSLIWGEFSGVTEGLERALAAMNMPAIGDYIRFNHRLLCTLGVVPEPVQQFVRGVEAQGGAAKISGAGAVAGAAGGLILVYYPEAGLKPVLPKGYDVMDMELDRNGTRVRS